MHKIRDIIFMLIILSTLYLSQPFVAIAATVAMLVLLIDIFSELTAYKMHGEKIA